YDKFKLLKVSKSDKSDPELPPTLSKNILLAKQTYLKKGLTSEYIKLCYEAYSKQIISYEKLSETLLANDDSVEDILSLFHLKTHV
ncbi:MAG: hypothetical protein PHV30_07680, partial [Candidatus Margulisbacteria bacterium]|nr:hypothetical protein [Candidatus Margulisiibacteriota bacterium]